MADAVGIDIGGTNVRVAEVTADGTVGEVRRHATPSDPDQLAEVVAQLHGGVDGAVGLGIAGGITADGVLRGAPNLPGIEGAPVRALLEERLGRKVVVTNDASAATWAEFRLGAGRDTDDLVMLTLGTGVGGGAVIAGRPLVGASGLAGEFGHMIVHEGGAACNCGNHGCLEAYASGTAMGMDGMAASEVAASAREGDEAARAHLATVGGWVGVGFAGLVAALDPGVLVLGGGAGAATFDLIAPAARTALAERLYARAHREPPPLVRAELGDDAGVAGAALLALREDAR